MQQQQQQLQVPPVRSGKPVHLHPPSWPRLVWHFWACTAPAEPAGPRQHPAWTAAPPAQPPCPAAAPSPPSLGWRWQRAGRRGADASLRCWPAVPTSAPASRAPGGQCQTCSKKMHCLTSLLGGAASTGQRLVCVCVCVYVGCEVGRGNGGGVKKDEYYYGHLGSMPTATAPAKDPEDPSLLSLTAGPPSPPPALPERQGAQPLLRAATLLLQHLQQGECWRAEGCAPWAAPQPQAPAAWVL